MELESDTWLVQRLTRLIGKEMKEPKSKWKMEDGKISTESMDAHKAIYDYDYMGAAEFEFGAIPKILKEMIARKMTAFPIDCLVSVDDYSTVKQSRTSPVYILCPEDQVEQRVVLLMGEKTPRLKEGLQKYKAYGQKGGRTAHDVVGWLEMDNGFYFFADKQAWQYTTKLYTGEKPA
jgi:hypothetical protein